MLDSAGALLRERIAATFQRPIDEALPDAEFNELALAVFHYQFERNAPYAAYCRTRGRTAANTFEWRDVPPVPTAAFKHVALVAGNAAAAEARFRTSGTTLGSEQRGTHYLLDTGLYHRSLLPAFAAHLLPDGAVLPMFSLLPAAAELTDSSLAHMIEVVMRELGAEGSRSFASGARGIHESELEQALLAACAAGRSVCLLGTSLSFVHWLDSLRARGLRFRLPPGSRLMDTGGYKGRGRHVPAEEMSASYRDLLGLDETHCVNEYGMTELCSQQYDAHLRDRVLGRRERLRVKQAPPWMRTRVVDAETLGDLPDGEPGLLQHFDLANLGSVLAVQTEDIGVRDGGGIRLLGRVTDAPPRGCSIAMDDLLRASREERT